MNASTRSLASGTTPVPETGVPAESYHRPVTAAGHAFRRASSPDYWAWLSHVTPAAGCTRPVQLAGDLATIEAATGRLVDVRSTGDMPDGVIYTPCGNRRATVCPSCAETYRRDAFQLLRGGLVGGRDMPDTIARHPAVFVTLTAPSFGPVHGRRLSRTGRVLPCRPRREVDTCPHGVDLACHDRHTSNDPRLGAPLCPDCYDHDAHVVWNSCAGELWRRTRIRADRLLTRTLRTAGLPTGTLRLRYAKVAEFQTRGVVHFHALVRLDGCDPDRPDQILPPPAGFGTDALTRVIDQAVTDTGYTTDPHPELGHGWHITWGTQYDIRPLHLGSGDLTDTTAAGYLAKYATKATESTGHTSRRLDGDTIDLYADPAGSHPERLIAACWRLGAHKGWSRLRRWAHMLGFGGHFLTKARAYSVTLTHLRQRRQLWHTTTDHTDAPTTTDEETTLTVGWLQFVTAGWRTTGDALLANTAADLARQRRQTEREELSTTG